MGSEGSIDERLTERLPVGDFVLDLAAGELLTRSGDITGLRRQALEVLLVLGRRAGHVVNKDELMRRVWPNVVVGEGSLVQAIADIRHVLGDRDHVHVRTIARRGYMLTPNRPSDSAERFPANPSDAPERASPDAAVAARPTPRRNRELMRAAGAACLLVLAGALAWLATGGHESWQSPAAAARRPLPEQIPALSIAFMPLTLEGDARDLEWLADALHGDLITEITRTTRQNVGLVIARGSTTLPL